MNFFGPIKNYSDMQRRISFISSIGILIGLIALSNLVPQISEFFKQISLTHELDIKGLKIQAIIPIASFVIGMFFEHAIGFHNIISDVFGIRYRFDKNVIITEFLRVIGEEKKLVLVTRKNRESIMRKVFYEYASSTTPKIDEHLIHYALGKWSWYWIIINTSVYFCVFVTVYLCFIFSFKTLIICIGILFFLIFFAFLLKTHFCKSAAMHEVEEILNDASRKASIKQYFKSNFK